MTDSGLLTSYDSPLAVWITNAMNGFFRKKLWKLSRFIVFTLRYASWKPLPVMEPERPSACLVFQMFGLFVMRGIGSNQYDEFAANLAGAGPFQDDTPFACLLSSGVSGRGP
jgi:hypothetical protein